MAAGLDYNAWTNDAVKVHSGNKILGASSTNAATVNYIYHLLLDLRLMRVIIHSVCRCGSNLFIIASNTLQWRSLRRKWRGRRRFCIQVWRYTTDVLVGCGIDVFV
mmetsp:Transcript_3028/g.8525  ORF Transcript_3028/g.8525 Transcript_3028/m.8525 type:complete len:106 (-) Transcript_3028:1089-1406(-)